MPSAFRATTSCCPRTSASSICLLASVTASISWIRSARNFGGRCEPTAHDDGIIGQFEGYERLEELDWERYRLRYGNIQRLELILEAENDSANRYKASKQADVIMLFYLFSADELREIFGRLGYELAHETITHNVDYYDRRSSHGSTSCRVVHAWVLTRVLRSDTTEVFPLETRGPAT